MKPLHTEHSFSLTAEQIKATIAQGVSATCAAVDGLMMYNRAPKHKLQFEK